MALKNKNESKDLCAKDIIDMLKYSIVQSLPQNIHNITDNLRIALGDTVLIVGDQRIGNTTIVKNIIEKLDVSNNPRENQLKIFIGLLFHDNRGIDYSDFSNETWYIGEDFDNNNLRCFINYPHNSCIVLDNIRMQTLNNPILTELSHKRNSIKIISTQIAQILNINFKRSVNYIILMGGNMNVSLLFEEFGGYMTNYNYTDFFTIYNQLDNHGCLIINCKQNIPPNRRITSWISQYNDIEH